MAWQDHVACHATAIAVTAALAGVACSLPECLQPIKLLLIELMNG